MTIAAAIPRSPANRNGSHSPPARVSPSRSQGGDEEGHRQGTAQCHGGHTFSGSVTTMISETASDSFPRLRHWILLDCGPARATPNCPETLTAPRRPPNRSGGRKSEGVRRLARSTGEPHPGLLGAGARPRALTPSEFDDRPRATRIAVESGISPTCCTPPPTAAPRRSGSGWGRWSLSATRTGLPRPYRSPPSPTRISPVLRRAVRSAAPC